MAEPVAYPSEYTVNKINQIHPAKIRTIIAVIAGFLFIPFTGSVHLFDWDEINFAEAAREMLVTGNFLNVQINFRAFPEKLPLFIWMQALSMNIFGVNEFAGRFPNAICGMATLTVLFLAGRKISEEWLLTGETDRDVYFVTKIHRARPLEFYTDITKAGEADGFVLYHRKRK